MGKINTIYNPNEWEIVQAGESKIYPNDYVYKVVIGEYDDYPEVGPLTEFISKEIYEGILSGEYNIVKDPYGDQKIIVVDKNNNPINLLRHENIDEKNNRELLNSFDELKKLGPSDLPKKEVEKILRLKRKKPIKNKILND